MRNLRLPEGVASVTVFDQSYGKDGVIRDVEDHVAAEIMSHDPRITEFAEGGEGDPDSMPGNSDRKSAFLARVAEMSRAELFAAARTLQVSAPANLKTDAIKEIVIRHAIAADDQDIPMVVSSTAAPADGGPILMTAEVAASANRGNDSLGQGRGPAPAPTGGSTFQAPHPDAADPAARPAPSGLGILTPAGTSQPPYNQVDTLTGQPTSDASIAPFATTVPPIDPNTGLPFRAGDPRIPATALPPVRQEPVIAQASVDAIHEAAARIDDASVAGSPPLSTERPLMSPSNEAARAASADAAGKVAPGTDPNHGNDTEGEKSKTTLKN